MRLCHPVPIPWRARVFVCVCVYVCVYRCLCLCDVTQSELWHVALLGALLLKWWLTCVYVCVSVYVSVYGCLCLRLCPCVCGYTSVFTFVQSCILRTKKRRTHGLAAGPIFFVLFLFYFFPAHVRTERYTLNEEKKDIWPLAAGLIFLYFFIFIFSQSMSV